MLNSKQLKKNWKRDLDLGIFAGSFKDWLNNEAKRANPADFHFNNGETYPDAAALLLARK